MKQEENKKQEELNEEQLDNVSGGCAGKDMPDRLLASRALGFHGELPRDRFLAYNKKRGSHSLLASSHISKK